MAVELELVSVSIAFAIVKERVRQSNVMWSIEHDDNDCCCALCRAALNYVAAAAHCLCAEANNCELARKAAAAL